MPPTEEPQHNAAEPSRRVLRAELVIAALALIASACASVATIVQTRELDAQTRSAIEQTQLVSKQLGASLWPYVTIDERYSPTSVRVGLTNQGLGPALIRTLTISVDGRERPHVREVLDMLDPPRRGRQVSESDLGAGSVLRPAENFTDFAISDPKLDRMRVQAAMQRVRLSVCYCSLLDDCWSLNSIDTQPHVVHRCGHQGRKLSI
jgi:hypothetical protein